MVAATEDFMANDVRTKKDGDALGCYGDIGWQAFIWMALSFFETYAAISGLPNAMQVLHQGRPVGVRVRKARSCPSASR